MFYSTLGRTRIGNNFVSLTHMRPKEFSSHAGGIDNVGRNIFMLQWRRAHSYTAPVPAGNGRQIETYEAWRSQLPPDGPNFCCFPIEALSGNFAVPIHTLTACCMAQKMGGQNACAAIITHCCSLLGQVAPATYCDALCGGSVEFYRRKIATTKQWLEHVNGGLLFQINVPENCVEGQTLQLSQPDGQVVSAVIPSKTKLSGNSPRTIWTNNSGLWKIVIPTQPSGQGAPNLAEQTFQLPHGVVAHLLCIEQAVTMIVFETPCVINNGPNNSPSYNPLWTGAQPTLYPAEHVNIANNYARARGLLHNESMIEMAQELVATAAAIDSIPQNLLWTSPPTAAALLQMLAGRTDLQVQMVGGRQCVGIPSVPQTVPQTVPQNTNQPFQVQVPPNASQGDSIMVQSPSGCIFSVELPPGIHPGDTIIVNMPDEFNGEPTTVLAVPSGGNTGGNSTINPATGEQKTRENELRTMSAHDTDGDGNPDTVGIDTTGDGIVDSFRPCILIDTTGDGLFDAMRFDSTGDGQHDAMRQLSQVPGAVPVYAESVSIQPQPSAPPVWE